jgi:Ca2+-binding RTX toxin-like protein
MARHRELDLDPSLDAPEATPLARRPLGDGIYTPDDMPANTGINPALDDVHVDLGGGVLAPAANAAPNKIEGTAGNDFIYGTAGKDVIRGLGGDDFIIAGDGDDKVSGDAGNDMIFGGEGHDQINGNDGDDLLRGNAGNDSLWGANGNDLLEGSEGDDRLDGGDGLDSLFGGAGSDSLKGGKGLDILTGGEGRDFFVADLNFEGWNPHLSAADVVTDFNPFGWPRDCVDLRVILAKTTFTGTTAQEAYDQGCIQLSPYQVIDDNGNIERFGTLILIDQNGSEWQPRGQGVAAVLALDGVHTNELGFSAYASHFLV